MKTPLFYTGPVASNVVGTSDRFAPLAGGGTTATALATQIQFIAGAAPIAGTIRRLAVRFPTTITQGSYEITLMKGATPTTMTATGLSVTIVPGAQSPQNLVTSVSVAAGEFLAWRIRPSGTPESQTNSIQIACIFDAATPGEGLLWATSLINGTFASFGIAAPSTAENDATIVMPASGTISNMRVNLAGNSVAPGTGNSRTFTLRKGTAYGALSDTALGVTISGSDTTGTDTDSVTVAAGDLLSIGITSSGTPPASAALITARWVPDNAGEAVVMTSCTAAISASATRFLPFTGLTGGAETGETNVGAVCPAPLTVKRVHAATVTAPGTGRSRAARLRKNGADAALLATIADTATAANASADIEFTTGDLVNFAHVPSGTPASSSETTFSAAMIVSAAADDVVFAPGDRNGQTFDGVRNTGANQRTTIGGTYGGSKTDIQVSLWDAPTGGNVVKNWTSATVQTGGVYSHTFTDVPVGGPYYHRVRDNGGTATNSGSALFVGAKVVIWGQSQAQRLGTVDINGLSPLAGINARVLTTSNIQNVAASTITNTTLTNGMAGVTNATGAGVVALANQWHRDVGASVPLQIVMCAYEGTSIEKWINDDVGDPGNPTTLWGTSPTTGLAWHMADAAAYQASMIVFMQGTSNLSGLVPATYQARMDDLKAKFEALYNGTAIAPLFAVLPHQRSDDGSQVFNMRNAQFAKGSSGGRWRVLCSLLDWRLDGDGSAHQAALPSGNARGGTRMGRGVAKWLNDNTLDTLGPRILRAEFSDIARNVINIDFDRDISLADGTVFAGSPVTLPAGWVVSTDSGATFPALISSGLTAELVGARRVRLTKTSGSWPTGTTRVDYLRGTPYGSEVTTDDFVGPEADMEANFLSKVITDTGTFDGGRGMPFAPPMGTGFAVVETGAAVTFGPITITVEDAVGTTDSLAPFNIAVSL